MSTFNWLESNKSYLRNWLALFSSSSLQVGASSVTALPVLVYNLSSLRIKLSSVWLAARPVGRLSGWLASRQDFQLVAIGGACGFKLHLTNEIRAERGPSLCV